MLLINENLAVSRIINLIAHKENLEVEEFETLNSVIKDRYDFILIDNDSYKDGMISEIKGRFKYKKLVFIAPKNGGKPLGFDDILFKPFLPVDFLKVIDKVNIQDKNRQKEREILRKVETKPSTEVKVAETTPTQEEKKEPIVEDVKSKVEDITKKGVEFVLSSKEIREILKDMEITIKVSFDFKDKKENSDKKE